MSWWISQPGGAPTGPISTEMLLRSIFVGRLPAEILVCRVGDQEWRPVTSIQRFADAYFARRRPRRSTAEAPTFVEPRPASQPPPLGGSPPPRERDDSRTRARRNGP